MRVLIVGASLAGFRTVQSLRALGSDAQITMIGDEIHLPYDRPPLSKAVLLGKVETPELALATPEELVDLDVDLRTGVEAVDLSVAERTVTMRDGSNLSADSVVIATGARARNLAGTEHLSNVYVLRSLDDALAIRDAMSRARRLVVIGSGFIGSEVASVGCDLGLEVTVIEAMSTPMARVLGPRIGGLLGSFHGEAGSDLLCGVTVASFVADHGVAHAVELADGRSIAGDIFVVGVGSLPNTEWLQGSGIDIADGVLCDDRGRVIGAGGVYAAGDVARWMVPGQGAPIRTEHWTAAGEEAAVIAANIVGAESVPNSVPYVWSDQFGHRIQVIGRPGPQHDVHLLSDRSSGVAALTGVDGVVTGAVVVDQPKMFGKLRRLVVGAAPWIDAVAAYP
ncbi:FAD-dependent oxidoreductase [Gordonia sp. i37]|uniref:NAD(P)/FAD-dependent oxidoreductase n=1 Tax=Gordonia sp. i37 TaxID=1961707 RepID=UPI0009AD2E11|nr:FAD-dependent oxidoreductase [Gordonia sp. i37]OPX06676.1 hypothetical protein B1964_28475 [Gordonia sp. i37]